MASPGRRVVTSHTPGPVHRISAIGDSLTFAPTYMVHPHLLWATLLETQLADAGKAVLVDNCGKNGDTSTGALARVARMVEYGVPAVGIVWIGANDPGNDIEGAQTQANIVSIGEYLFDAGAEYVVVGNTQYLNYSSGGDTVNAQNETYATLKTFQQAAYAELLADHAGKVLYCDTYAYMRSLIVAGTVTQGDWAAFHVADMNQHFNESGNGHVADAMYATFAADSGIMDAIA